MAKTQTRSKATPVAIWQAAQSPVEMFPSVRGLLSSRRLRCYAIACCKTLWGQSRTSPGYDDLLRLAERMAEADVGQLGQFAKQIAGHRRVSYPHGVIHLLAEDADRAVNAWLTMVDLNADEKKRLAQTLQEVAGNPFASPTFDSTLITWRDGAIPKLARACYDSNDFSMIGILGDALEEAGCSEHSILDHVRSERTHHRGCWVVDLILGKK